VQVYQWLLTLGAVLRIVRFLNADVLAEPFRAWVERTFGVDSKPAYLVTCPWCASIWVALFVVPISYLAAGDALWFIACSILTISWLVGIADANLERE
jgi:hypothetical protein